MKSYREILDEAKQKKPNPYAKAPEANPDFVYKKYPESKTHKIGDWETVKTDHANERAHERGGGDLPGGHHEFMSKVVAHVSKLKEPKNGEYYYHSKKHDQGAFLYVHHNPKQIRVKTILPKSNTTLARAGDKKIMLEGVEYDVIMLDEDLMSFKEFISEN